MYAKNQIHGVGASGGAASIAINSASAKIEADEFKLLIDSLNWDQQAYRVWKAKVGDHLAAVSSQKLRWVSCCIFC